MKTMQSFEIENDLEEMVLKQLDKILKHPPFLSSRILSGFLNFIVSETLAGRQDQIKEYTIAVHVLNKPVSFEPSHNAIVRIHARRLRYALLRYYNQKDCRDIYMITIPKGRYVPLFEKSDNQTLKKSATVPLYNECELKKNRIAFMPFKKYDQNMSQASFMDSLGEELTRQFSLRSNLSVLSYHTTRLLSPENTEIKNMVSAYQVKYIISGSSWFEHSKIKVFIELIDAGSEIQLWSAIYYQTVAGANYFRAVHKIASALMSDLCIIKSLECNQITDICENLNSSKTEILYFDRYSKNPKPVRRLAGNE